MYSVHPEVGITEYLAYILSTSVHEIINKEVSTYERMRDNYQDKISGSHVICVKVGSRLTP